MWAISVNDEDAANPALPVEMMRGSEVSYEACQAEAANIRARGYAALTAPSAALSVGATRGWMTNAGLKPGPDSDGRVHVLFGVRPDAVAWRTELKRAARRPKC